MKNQLSAFNFNENTAIRTAVANDGNVWFVAKDLADALEYSETARALEHCKQSTVKVELNKINELSPATKWIPESDVFRLIMRSNKTEAEKFQDWVVEDVLPTIRKTGGYTVPKAEKVSLVPISKEMRAALSLAKMLGLTGNQAYLHADEATNKVIGQSPIALLGIDLSSPAQERHFTPTELAKMVGLKSAIAFNKELEAKGYQEKINISKDKWYWTPTKKGEQFAVLLDKNKTHTHGTVQQLEWRESIKSELLG